MLARILVIDDEAQVRAFLRSTLEASGHDVAEAADGDAGLQSFATRPADLVITDIVMPKKEGIKTIRTLREHNPALKIIAISGAGRVGDYDFLDIASKFGAARTLAKPFGDRQLVHTVQDILAD